MPLDKYREKRVPGGTPEPMPSAGEAASGAGTHEGQFVVHGHDARRMHFDLRFEVNGALLSFACPKGATLDPAIKHLAVRTEEHPLEYVDFEDTIPAGNYGAGPMIVWDRGVMRWLEIPAEEQLERGKLDFVLYGRKLRGRFSLIPLKDRPNYLLLKKKDAFAIEGAAPLDPRSLYCGLHVAELPELPQRWRALRERIATLPGILRRAHKAQLAPRLLGLPTDARGVLWDFVPQGAFRVLCTRRGNAAQIESDAGELITDFYPDLVAAVVHGLARDYAVELLLWRPRERELTRLPAPCQALAIDVLAVDDFDVSALPLARRRELLATMFPGPGIVRALAPFEAPHDTLLASVAAAQGQLHGILGRSDHHEGAVFLAPDGAPPLLAPTHGDAGPRSQRVAQTRPKRTVSLTNRTKPFFPGWDPAHGMPTDPTRRVLTKGDLLDYYASVAEVLLPHLRDRALILERFPDGVDVRDDAKHFYQWRPPPGAPSWLQTIEIPEHRPKARPPEKKPKRAFVLEDVESLLYVVNLGCIPLHLLGFAASAPARCVFATVDFDVKQSGLEPARPLVRALGGLLERVGLRGFLKTSGRTGLHVLMPLGAGIPFPAAQALVELLGRWLVATHPKQATREERIDKRGTRVYIDTGQTGAIRSIAAPYSVRPVPDARVSMPVPWSDVESVDPTRFTIRTVPREVAVHGDVWSRFREDPPDLARAIDNLQAEVS